MKSKVPAMKTTSGHIKSMSVEVWRFCDSDKERRAAWIQMSRDVKTAMNLLWQNWLAFHVLNDSAEKLREDIQRFRDWEAGGKKGPKPKWRVSVFPQTDWVYSRPKQAYRGKVSEPDLQTDLYHIVGQSLPGFTKETITLIINKWASLLKSRKAASGNLPGWASILLGNEGLPTFTNPLPIPFSKKSGSGPIPLVRDGDKTFLEVTIQRKDSGKSVFDRCELVLNKRKCRNARVVVDRVISGEYEFKGSQLVFDRGKWFVNISYGLPDAEAVPVTPGRSLLVCCAKSMPWRLAVFQDGEWVKTFSVARGVERQVGVLRWNIQRQREARQAGYRWARKNRKGHGIRRAESAWTKLSDRWADGVNNINNNVTKRIVGIAITEGCEVVEYRQPTNDRMRSTRLLSRVGNDERSSTTWEFYKFGSMLSQKCQQAGIRCDVVRTASSQEV